jgi:hypothetical protein
LTSSGRFHPACRADDLDDGWRDPGEINFQPPALFYVQLGDLPRNAIKRVA